jgi:hypothetical protein
MASGVGTPMVKDINIEKDCSNMIATLSARSPTQGSKLKMITGMMTRYTTY